VARFRELIEDLCRGRPRAGLGLAAAGNCHLAEDDVADLLGAARVDRLARDLLDFGLDPRGGLANSPDSVTATSRSIEMPRRSIRASTEISGRSRVS